MRASASVSAGVCVSELRANPFTTLCLEEKISVKRRGRATPALDIMRSATSKGTRYVRRFNASLYEKHDWLCGCAETNALFCFPCLLFGGDKTWTKTGTSNLSKIHFQIGNHERSCVHINNVHNLAILGKVNTSTIETDRDHLDGIRRHNLAVEGNREALSRMVNCLRLCGGFERGCVSENPLDEYRALVDLTQRLDKELRVWLEYSPALRGVQSDLLRCMLGVCREELAKEIQRARFLALIADETTDVSTSDRVHLVVMFRYIANGVPVERFWGFFNADARKPGEIAHVMKQQLDTVIPDQRDKLIAQSYDCATLMKNVHADISRDYPLACKIHCYDHRPDRFVERAARAHPKAREFFAYLNRIPVFFAHSSSRLAALDSSSAIPLRWSHNTCWVNLVYTNYDTLLDCFDKLQHSDQDTQATVIESTRLRTVMKKTSFVTFLHLFHCVMNYVEKLSQQLQFKDKDAVWINKIVSNFVSTLRVLKSNVSDGSLVLEPRRPRVRKHSALVEDHTRASLEVLEVIIDHVIECFKYTDHLAPSALFFSSKFKVYNKKFPAQTFFKTVHMFPFLDKNQLETELEIVYSRTDLRPKSRGSVCPPASVSVSPLLTFLLQCSLEHNYSETARLLHVVSTMPASQRRFSTKRRLSTFLGRDGMSALAMLAVEKQLIDRIDNFNEKVINKFAQLDGRMSDFLHKSSNCNY